MEGLVEEDASRRVARRDDRVKWPSAPSQATAGGDWRHASPQARPLPKRPAPSCGCTRFKATRAFRATLFRCLLPPLGCTWDRLPSNPLFFFFIKALRVSTLSSLPEALDAAGSSRMAFPMLHAALASTCRVMQLAPLAGGVPKDGEEPVTVLLSAHLARRKASPPPRLRLIAPSFSGETLNHDAGALGFAVLRASFDFRAIMTGHPCCWSSARGHDSHE